MTDDDALARIRVVLVGPREPGNVGAAARALKNMGLRQLVIAEAPALDLAAARRMAVHADDVLATARVVARFADAVADCGLVVGTSGRADARIAPSGAIATSAAWPTCRRAPSPVSQRCTAFSAASCRTGSKVVVTVRSIGGVPTTRFTSTSAVSTK